MDKSEIRLECLKLAAKFRNNGSTPDNIIDLAKPFEAYATGTILDDVKNLVKGKSGRKKRRG
jgi:hypothetical protein